MNIKVAAFTVCKKSSNTNMFYLQCHLCLTGPLGTLTVVTIGHKSPKYVYFSAFLDTPVHKKNLLSKAVSHLAANILKFLPLFTETTMPKFSDHGICFIQLSHIPTQ